MSKNFRSLNRFSIDIVFLKTEQKVVILVVLYTYISQVVDIT